MKEYFPTTKQRSKNGFTLQLLLHVRIQRREGEEQKSQDVDNRLAITFRVRVSKYL